MESYRLWGRIIRHHRIAKSETVPIEGGDLEGALLEICRRFDVQRPLQLPKHERDLEAFGRTFYSREHFTEPIDFQKLESAAPTYTRAILCDMPEDFPGKNMSELEAAGIPIMYGDPEYFITNNGDVVKRHNDLLQSKGK